MSARARVPQRLDGYASTLDRGRSAVAELAWLVVSAIAFESFVPGSGWRRRMLRAFGATIGDGVVIKPGVKIKFPWRLRIGAHAWIGERVWIDNLDRVSIGPNVCISQGTYLCTGSHDWRRASFDLRTRPIEIGESAWVTAFCRVAPGARIEAGAMFPMGSVIAGNPARVVSQAGAAQAPTTEIASGD